VQNSPPSLKKCKKSTKTAIIAVKKLHCQNNVFSSLTINFENFFRSPKGKKTKSTSFFPDFFLAAALIFFFLFSMNFLFFLSNDDCVQFLFFDFTSVHS